MNLAPKNEGMGRVRKGIDTHVLLSFDRFSGALKAIAANDSNLSEIQRLKEANAKNAVIRSVLLILVLGIVWLALKSM